MDDMTSKSFISSHCRIKDNRIDLNGSNRFQGDYDQFSEFIKSAYKSEQTKYPKFFKMDNLSKLAFLCADILLKETINTVNDDTDIALVFSNKASSLDTDRKHQQTIQDKNNYYPSPAIFVYTLPNICMGEISIKFRLYSENSFFIFENFNGAHLLSYANSLMAEKKASKVLCGWVDFDDENNYDAFLYLVGETGELAHNLENITRLYNT